MRLSQLPRRTKGRDIDLRSIHVTGAWTCCCTVALDRSFRRNPRKSVLHGSVPTSHFLPSDERRGSWGPSFPPPPTSFFLLIQVTESRAKILGGRHRGGVPPVVCPARPYPQIRRLFDTGESQNHPRPRTPGEAKPSGYPYDSASRLRRGTGDRGFRRPGGGNDRSSLPGRSRCDPLKGSKPCWERNIPPFPPRTDGPQPTRISREEIPRERPSPKKGGDNWEESSAGNGTRVPVNGRTAKHDTRTSATLVNTSHTNVRGRKQDTRRSPREKVAFTLPAAVVVRRRATFQQEPTLDWKKENAPSTLRLWYEDSRFCTAAGNKEQVCDECIGHAFAREHAAW